MFDVSNSLFDQIPLYDFTLGFFNVCLYVHSRKAQHKSKLQHEET